ncbi:MAG: hypothetical protein JOZ62_18040, partial [Acidobacteriaceae bacterium]|nr:hypothetical protein [Acidobacteriaceae bacterium]
MTRRTFLAGAAAPALATASPLNWIATNIKGEVLSRNWPQCEDLVSTGSLLKPFVAISYLATHTQAPVIVCQGARAGCWFAPGHGRQDLSAALANSCNVYFLRIANGVNRAALDMTCLSYGLVPAARAWDAHRLIGLSEGWPQSPIAVAQAFAALTRNATDA